jgi:hypothetical protein
LAAPACATKRLKAALEASGYLNKGFRIAPAATALPDALAASAAAAREKGNSALDFAGWLALPLTATGAAATDAAVAAAVAAAAAAASSAFAAWSKLPAEAAALVADIAVAADVDAAAQAAAEAAGTPRRWPLRSSPPCALRQRRPDSSPDPGHQPPACPSRRRFCRCRGAGPRRGGCR